MTDVAEIVAELDALGTDIWDTRPAPRGHGGEWVEVAVVGGGTLIAQVYNVDDAEFIAHAPEHVANLLALVDALTRERDAARAELAEAYEEQYIRENNPHYTPADPSDLLDYNALAAQRTADLLARHNEEHTP